jgi:WW domain-containing oxidoreductase
MAEAKFGKRSTAEDVTEGVDLTAKVALVTGVNSGIGSETLRVLASRGAHVIGTARTLEKAQQGCAQADGATTPLACELTDLDSIRACVESVAGQFDKLDIVVANAGIMALPKLEQVRGIEKQFATNHLGHFLLITSLLDRLADGARVVMVSSGGHVGAPKEGIQFDNLSGENGYSALRAYGQSKLANILFARSLSQRMAGRATANSLHPGVIATHLGRHMNPLLSRVLGIFFMPFAKSVGQGAATSCLLAASPSVQGVTGRYFSDCREARSSDNANDDALAERLWEVSVQLVG